MIEQPPVEVATFNIRNGLAWDKANSWPFRARATADVARDLHVDVLGLQEAVGFQLRSLGKALSGMQVCGRGRMAGGRGEHVAVFVNTERFVVVDEMTRWFSDQPDLQGTRLPGSRFPRIATIVRLRDASDQEIVVANTHLDEHSAENRLRSAELLCDWLAPFSLPTIVVGDLNDVPTSPPLERFRQAGLVSALAADAGGTEHKFRGDHDGEQIDYVLVSPHWTVVNARIDYSPGRRLPSDHWPVAATLVLNSPS